MKLKYTIHRLDGYSRQYEHIEINVYRACDLDSSWAKPCLTLKWQGDRDSDHWYGFHASLDVDNLFNSTELFPVGTNILKRLYAAQVDSDNIQAVIDAIGADRIVSDNRANEWLPLDKVAPSDWQRYMAWMDGSCACSVVARDEEHAQKELLKRFVQNADSWSSSLTRMEAWITAGKPVRVDDYAKAPDVRSLTELLKPMKDPAPAVESEPVAA